MISSATIVTLLTRTRTTTRTTRTRRTTSRKRYYGITNLNPSFS